MYHFFKKRNFVFKKILNSGMTAEEKCNGPTINAFYELRGLRYESSERYQGRTDKNGNDVIRFVISVQ